MQAIDTNVLLRCLIDDDSGQAARARMAVRSGPVFLTLTVLLEAEWVLRDVYEIPRAEVLGKLESFCDLPTVVLASEIVAKAAFNWAKSGLDFADALHLAQATGCESFLTFDRKLINKAPSEAARVVQP